jgi:hypothetical protein
MKRLGSVVLAAALPLACASLMWQTERAHEIQAELVGRDSLFLRRCLGTPSEFEEHDGGETWFHAYKLEPDVYDAVPYYSPQFDSAKPLEVRIQEFLMEPSRAPLAPGYCLLRTELAATRRIVGTYVHGLDSRALNADAFCTLMIEPCLAASAQ